MMDNSRAYRTRRRCLLQVTLLIAAAFVLAGALTDEDAYTNVEGSSSVVAASSTPPFAIFGYLPEYRQHRFPYEAYFKSGLTHLIFFSAEVDPQTLRLVHVDDRLPSPKEWKAIRQLATAHGVKLLLCIGGGGRSAGFPRLVSDALGRRRFIGEVNQVLLDRELDGIDFNWEYPSTTTEWLNFSEFLRELRGVLGYKLEKTGWRSSAKSTPQRRRIRPAVISMALHPHPTVPNVLQSIHMLPSLDYLQWMAYDHINSNNESHSSVAYAASVLSDDFIGRLNDAVYSARRGNWHGQRGVSQPNEIDHRRKVTLGIPFYGRHREDMRLQPETYEHLWHFIMQWARKRHPTWVEGGPELRALSYYAGYDFTGYDDVQRKMRLARKANVAGIMIWELGQDVPPGTSPMSLMTAIQEQLARWSALDSKTNARRDAVPANKGSSTAEEPAHTTAHKDVDVDADL